ncbi:MAG: hypothetical protein M1830_000855 [Pleopsidium flavum]|nr:MAG: hypothetical protein M1830_000855 [Pleopsidium flavum]
MAQKANTCDPFASITIDKHDDALCFTCQDEADVLSEFEQADEHVKAAVDLHARPKLFFKEYIQWEKCGHRSHLRWTDIERDPEDQEYLVVSETGQCFGCANVPAHQLKRMKLGPEPWGFSFDEIEGVPGSSSASSAEQYSHPILSSSSSSAAVNASLTPPRTVLSPAEPPFRKTHLNEQHSDNDDPDNLYDASPQNSEYDESPDHTAAGNTDSTESEADFSDDDDDDNPESPEYDTTPHKNKHRQTHPDPHQTHLTSDPAPKLSAKKYVPASASDDDDNGIRKEEFASHQALLELINAHDAPPELAIRDYREVGHTTLAQAAIPDWSCSKGNVVSREEDFSVEARRRAARIVERAMEQQRLESTALGDQGGSGNSSGCENGTRKPWYTKFTSSAK